MSSLQAVFEGVGGIRLSGDHAHIFDIRVCPPVFGGWRGQGCLLFISASHDVPIIGPFMMDHGPSSFAPLTRFHEAAENC